MVRSAQGDHLVRVRFPAFSDGRGFSHARDLRSFGFHGRLRAAVAMKARSIARHDAKLKQSQPMRNVSIPDEGGR